MIHEHFDGTVREVHWGELQELSNRFANVLRAHGVREGRPRGDAAAADARDRGGVLRHVEVGRDPALDVGALRRRRHPPPRERLAGEGAGDQRGQPGPRRSGARRARAVLDDDVACDAATPAFEREDTLADDPAQLYYTCGTTGLAKGIVHAHRYLLAHEEFIYCHDVQDGERFHGMGEWAWAAGIAPLLGPWRFGAVQLVYQREGGFDPHKQLDFLSRHEASNVFTTPTAMRSMMSITRRGHALPAAVPDRVQRRRAAEPGGDPLVPRAVRADRARLLRADRVLSAVSPTTRSWRSARARWAADARLGRADPRPGRAAGAAGRARRDLPARALEPALSARLLAQRGGGAGDVRRRLVPHQGRRQVRRGRLRLVRGPRGRRDHRRGLPDRPVRGRVGLPGARRGQGGGGGRVARRAAGQRRQGVHRARRRARGLRRVGTRHPEPRAFPAVRLRLPSEDRVRRGPPEDPDRQDPPHRAAPA